MLFEANVLNGKLMMTTMNITGDDEKRIVARQMRKSILDYMNSDNFRPQHNITTDMINDLYTKVSDEIKSYTKGSPNELKPKIN